jgi:hypothetical protein
LRRLHYLHRKHLTTKPTVQPTKKSIYRCACHFSHYVDYCDGNDNTRIDVAESSNIHTSSRQLLCLILFKVLRLLKNLLIHLIPVNRWVAVFGQHQDQVYFEFGLDVGALTPVGVFEMVSGIYFPLPSMMSWLTNR